MLKKSPPEAGFSNSRLLLAVFLCLSGSLFVALSFARTPLEIATSARKNRVIANRQPQRTLNIAPHSATSGSSVPGWSIVTPPNSTNILWGSTCTSPSDCWAVGNINSIIHWDGAAWTVVPGASTTQASLGAVTCISHADCWVVGNGSTIEHWDGLSWMQFSAPTIPNQSNILAGVTCLSTSDCWAVGYYYDSASRHQTLIQHWDGGAWTIVPSPNVNGAYSNLLYGVACASSGDCWAVGYYGLGMSLGGPQTLTEHWDGNSWSIVASPNAASPATNFLSAVTCNSSSDCWAVGFFGGTGSRIPSQTLIEHWDGGSWSIVDSPNVSVANDTHLNILTSVTCSSASECWVAGYSYAGGPYQTLIEHWNGNAWSIFPSPSTPAADTEYLNSIACASTSQCWAVGWYTQGYVDKPLIEEYSLTIPPLIKAGSRMVHGTVGAFDVDLPLTGKRGVECRSGGANGNYSAVFTFVNDVNNCGTAATPGGSVVAGPNSNQCTENLTGVANAQYVSVELDNIVDSQNNAGNVAVQLRVLIGDTNADGFVDAIDVSQTKSQSGNATGSSNFREDINLDGFVDAIDTSFVKSKSGTSLPSPP